ncbi:MAG: ATP-dependent DNA ligase [Chloroflexi bacterium]|nr:ATP-dependent DNA ligase [Chloroflexota bacterium]
MTTIESLAQLSEQLAATKKKLEHAALIGAYLQSLPPDDIPLAARLLIGQVFPEGDPRILNISGAAIDRALGRGADLAAIEGAVDFGHAVEMALTNRGHARAGAPLSLAEVYAAYEEIAGVTGRGSRERRDARLRELFTRASALEAKYIVKHLIHEMRVGVNEGTLLDALARTTGIAGDKIRRAYQFTGDVGQVARAALLGGEDALAELKPVIGRPLKPMLAQSADDMRAAFAKMPLGEIALEFKLDGARVQIHKRGDEVRIFSRNLAELTGSLPEIEDLARRELQANEAIVEGEVIALTPEGRPRPFQELMRRIGREREIAEMQREIPVKLFLFDVLYRDGELLIDRPNAARWEQLGAIVGNIACVARIVPRDEAEGEQFLGSARAAGHEGLMAKNLASPYAPGERGKHWLKIKPILTLDLAIVAADWGYGRRTGWLSNVHLAARDEKTGVLLEVGKTFKGFTDAEFKALTERLLALKIKQTRGTVWVKPEIVVEVAFNNVQSSPVSTSRVALRFARVLQLRDDKSADQVDTVQTLQGLMERERGRGGEGETSTQVDR